MLKLHVLASGSKGNASIIENVSTGKLVLIDCGICKREFFSRSEEAGVDLANLEAIFITHEHTDHTKGLGVVTRGLSKQGIDPRIYVSNEVHRSSKELVSLRDACIFEAFVDGSALSAAGMQIHAFATSHDSRESYGFRIETKDDTLGYVTDNGLVTDKITAYLSNTRILALESNHDEQMLANGDYPYIIKRRIASDQGHLSNSQSSETLESLLHNKLEHVVAMHISENNNTYRLPKETLGMILERNTHSATVSVAYQNRVTSVS